MLLDLGASLDCMALQASDLRAPKLQVMLLNLIHPHAPPRCLRPPALLPRHLAPPRRRALSVRPQVAQLDLRPTRNSRLSHLT
jgi:hypothetical protein